MSITVWVYSVSPFEEGDDCGSFPIFGDLRRYEREVEQGLQQFRLIILEREGPDCLALQICRGPDFAALSEHQLSEFG